MLRNVSPLLCSKKSLLGFVNVTEMSAALNGCLPLFLLASAFLVARPSLTAIGVDGVRLH